MAFLIILLFLVKKYYDVEAYRLKKNKYEP